MAGSEGSAGEDQATQLLPGQDAVVVTRLVEPPGAEPRSATEIVPPQAATEAAAPQPATEAARAQPTTEAAGAQAATEAAGAQPATEAAGAQAATEIVPPRPPAEVAAQEPATQVVPQHPPTEVTSPDPATNAAPAHPPTEVASASPASDVAPAHPPTEVADSPGPADQAGPAPESTVGAAPGQAAGPGQQIAPPAPPAPLPSTADAMPPKSAAGIVRYGPGVPVVLPVSQGGRTAEHVWRGGQPPAPPPRSARLRRLGGSALTVVLLVASGVILFLRFYHPSFQVTGATVSQHTAAGCRVDVTGRVTTNGSAGTVTYRWLFKPGGQQATTLSQSVSSGQHAVDVTAALEGSGQGTASQTATLQVLSPDQQTASTRVTLNC